MIIYIALVRHVLQTLYVRGELAKNMGNAAAGRDSDFRIYRRISVSIALALSRGMGRRGFIHKCWLKQHPQRQKAK
jgi:hypothetical protein